ncbi:MAG: hypothetical protein MRY21_04970 [Simkaniaceae bacterium]|nr:hypothetical protein [Simkaniaceae bacterium]
MIDVEAIRFVLRDDEHPNDVQSTFGFHTRKTLPSRKREFLISKKGDRDKVLNDLPVKDCYILNGLNILGYIPVLGLISARERLYRPLSDAHHPMHVEPKNVKISLYVRGVFETVGLGSVYLVPDLLVTAKRFCSLSSCVACDLNMNYTTGYE